MNPREYEIMFAVEDEYWWYRGMRRVTRAFGTLLFSSAAGSWVLDAGCGTGRNLVELASAGARPAGIDISLRAIALARRRGARRLVCGSIEALPFRSDVFRGALSRDVLYMVPREAVALAEIARVLAPRGSAVLSSPAFRSLSGAHDRAVGGLRRHTAKELETLVEGAGLRVGRSTYANFWLAPGIWAVRALTRVGDRSGSDREAASDFPLSPAPLAGLFFSLLALEAGLIRRGFRLPFGATVFVRGEKPDQGTSVAGK